MCYCGMMQPILTEAICVSSGRASRSPSSSQLRGTSLPRRQGYCLGTMETFFSSSFPVGSATGKQRNPDMKSSLVCGERARKESHGSIVFALLRIIFSLQFPLLIANFSSFSKSRSTSALPPSPTRAGASRNCHRWAKEKHTCLFLIYLESSFFLVLLGRAAARLFWPRGWGLSPEDWPCRGELCPSPSRYIVPEGPTSW